MRIYIVIVTFNGMKWIENCLNKALNSSIPIQIVVVDNNSNDKTVSFIKENYSEIKLLEQDENLGFGAANNIGISYALRQGVDYIFLLNQDAYVNETTIEKLVEVSNNNKEFGIISPIHLNGSGNNLDLNFSNYMQKNTYLLFDALKNSYSKHVYEVPFVNAAAWLLPQKTFETIGGFDPIFFHYGEDENFCQRVLFHNLKVGLVPNIFINHDRENIKSKLSNSNLKSIQLRERYLKIKWANINTDHTIEMFKQQKKLRVLVLKLMMKLKLKKMKHYLMEYRIVKRIIPEILKSKEINIKEGTHYLGNFK